MLGPTWNSDLNAFELEDDVLGAVFVSPLNRRSPSMDSNELYKFFDSMSLRISKAS